MGGICSCRGRGSQVNAGSILDRVISQASNEDQCLLYRLANYKKGGELVESYNAGGQAEVEKVIREQFGILMYADGKGQIINRAEYLRWKFRDLEQVVLPIEASLSRFDPLAQWSDHEACWQMQYRGSLGETLLHVLIICDTRIHTRIARTLLKCFPRLAIDVVEGEEYLGASALHLAIAYNNNELVQDLVEAGAIVSQRATGSFFLPRDQQRLRPARNTDYEGLAYLGEYPLAWAACCANESVYNLLLDSGAHPDEQDSFGNMILHMVVVCDKLDMFGYALRHPKLPARNGIANSAGFTPLTLACQLGRAEVFREMLELSAREFWRYSNITCSAYPLNALDTLLPDGRTNWNSALFIILNGTKEEHLDMLDGGIIQRLLEEKWKTFARLQFLKRLVILVFHLISLSLAVYLRPGEMDSELLKWPEEITEIARTIAECITVLGVLSYILLQLGGEVVNIGLLSFLKQLSHEPAKFIFLISNILILACIPCRMAGDRHAEDAILVVAVPGSWFLLMFFAGAVRLTGPFVTMVYSMITGDMLTFGIIYMVVLFGFSQSFYFLYKGFPGVKSSLYSSYPSTWMALLQITLGDYNYTDLSHTTYPNLSKAVFAIFMVLVPILLLNMLIAMMGNTYAHVIEQSEKEWMKQWAKIVVSLERAVSQKDAHNYLQEYSIKLGPGDDPNNPASEQRGVMVIKSKSKTRAKQRKGAVSNWKRVGKVTINELRKRGMTGEELRCIMWGRASFSTPVRVPASPNIGEPDAAGSTVTGGFGDALTAALDVMALAHDLDLSTATQGIPTTSNQTSKVANVQGKVRPSNQGQAGLAVQRPVQPLSQSAPQPQAQSHGRSTADIVHEFGDKKTLESIDPEAVNTKAREVAGNIFGARCLDKAEIEIPSTSAETEGADPLLELVIASENSSCDQQALLKMAGSARDLSEFPLKSAVNVQLLERFSITKILTSNRLATVHKKELLLESSDNDVCNDSLLGAEARLRRIRSANSRYVLEKRQFRRDDGSSSSSPSVDTVSGYRILKNEPDETVNVASVGSAETNESTRTENSNGAKSHRKRRAKTAKNRVSPKEMFDSSKRRESDYGKKVASPPNSPTDPLEPWSTRGIKDMNTILAWKENGPDSP
ncbi:transient receptor potential cation channel subfamily V member 4 isoform X2 [Cephus cinctus]|uniref:Transient receptor potential cation channel subfamily V member 4 isoform X2 n=1 Tax=Cephus cinctus TaxID=211228 RepID=A0AAJ7FP35_CEPCN|nr:transient receptor potential cation channel subfamily V member 4 isoform X2 [Cephus cinctus]